MLVRSCPGKQRSAFTFAELLVVTVILAVLGAIIIPFLLGAKSEAKRSACAFNLRQMSIGIQNYVIEFDGFYPQTKGTFAEHPEIEDNAGQIELPDYGSPLRHLGRYTTGVMDCPSDPDVEDLYCANVPNANPQRNSYLFNGYLVWGTSEYQIRSVPDTVLLAERRSYPVGSVPPNCDVIFRPWYNPSNPLAPTNEMDPKIGSIAAARHNKGSNYLFADTHAEWFEFEQVWDPPNINRFTP